MRRKYAFDYIIIGSGPAGTASALTLAKRKRRIAIVEGRFFGGQNLNTRDIPYASALDFSHAFYKTRNYPELADSEFYFDYPTAISRRINTAIRAGANSKKDLESAGISCIEGFAQFLNPHTISVGEKQYTSANFILATGSTLSTGNIAGVDSVNYLTPETAIHVRHIPKTILVVGGGSTGVEIAQYYAELGAKVIIMEAKSRLLPREDSEVSSVITNHFTNQLGMIILPNCKVTALEQTQDASVKSVVFRNNSVEKMIRVESIVLATGSQPFLNYGLEKAKVKYKPTGIIVDKNLTTSAKNIYAIGDCTNLPADSSTDRSILEGTLLATNIIKKTKAILNHNGIVRTIKTSPTVAVVGRNEVDLKAKKIRFRKSLVSLSEITASKVEGFETGFVKLLTNSSGHILGCTIVSPYAEYMIEEIALAIRHHIPIREIATTPHSANSFNYAIKLTARQFYS